jgi:hypothetical protein
VHGVGNAQRGKVAPGAWWLKVRFYMRPGHLQYPHVLTLPFLWSEVLQRYQRGAYIGDGSNLGEGDAGESVLFEDEEWDWNAEGLGGGSALPTPCCCPDGTIEVTEVAFLDDSLCILGRPRGKYEKSRSNVATLTTTHRLRLGGHCPG